MLIVRKFNIYYSPGMSIVNIVRCDEIISHEKAALIESCNGIDFICVAYIVPIPLPGTELESAITAVTINQLHGQ